MTLKICDRCGRKGIPKDGEDYVEDWETVTVSTSLKYDICGTCSRLFFKFFEHADSLAREQNQAGEAS